MISRFSGIWSHSPWVFHTFRVLWNLWTLVNLQRDDTFEKTPFLCTSGPRSSWWWSLKFLRVKHEDFFCGNRSSHLSPGKVGLKICHQIFTTFCTLKFTMANKICHLMLTLGAISRFFEDLQRGEHRRGRVPKASEKENGFLEGFQRFLRNLLSI